MYKSSKLLDTLLFVIAKLYLPVGSLWCDDACERGPQGLQTAALLGTGDELRFVTKAVRTITVKAKYEKEKENVFTTTIFNVCLYQLKFSKCIVEPGFVIFAYCSFCSRYAVSSYFKARFSKCITIIMDIIKVVYFIIQINSLVVTELEYLT